MRNNAYLDMSHRWSLQDFLERGYHFQIDDTPNSFFAGIAINDNQSSVLMLTDVQIRLVKTSDLIRGATNNPNVWVYGVKP